jgi:Tat protein secretion system quality control protein TatD with DNase activity
MSMLIDSHVNLHAHAFDADRADVIGRARAAGVGPMVTICDQMQNFEAVLAIARADTRIGASVAAVMIAGIAGARAVRVHDVRASRQALQILDRATPAATPTIEREVRP